MEKFKKRKKKKMTILHVRNDLTVQLGKMISGFRMCTFSAGSSLLLGPMILLTQEMLHRASSFSNFLVNRGDDNTIAFDVEDECLAALAMPLASNHRIPDCC